MRRKIIPPAIRDERIVVAMNLWLAQNLTLSVREIAATTGLSLARFSHLFARTTGMLPGEFLRLLKCYRTEREQALGVLREAGVENEYVF